MKRWIKVTPESFEKYKNLFKESIKVQTIGTDLYVYVEILSEEDKEID